jgi:hypothetical protein
MPSASEGMRKDPTTQASSAPPCAARIRRKATLLPAKWYEATDSGLGEPDLGE